MSPAALQRLQNRLTEGEDLFVTEATGNLGYSIIRDFVRKLKGTIAVASEPDKGTAVTVLLPIE